MTKQFLLAASCLLALSVGTLLVSAAKHQIKHHPKKVATNMSQVGQEFYKESVEFVRSAQEFVEAFDNKSIRKAKYDAMVVEYKEMETEVQKHAPNAKKHRSAPKGGEVGTTQTEEYEDMSHMHNFSPNAGETSHQLSHQILTNFTKAAHAVLEKAKELHAKPSLTGVQKTGYITSLNTLTGAMEKVEEALGLTSNEAGGNDNTFNYSDENDA